MTLNSRALRQVVLDFALMVVVFTILGTTLTHHLPEWWYFALIVAFCAYRYAALSKKYGGDPK